jgi:hypothetical protein
MYICAADIGRWDKMKQQNILGLLSKPWKPF